MATRRLEEQTGTQRLYARLWSGPRKMAILGSLERLAEVYDRKLTPTMCQLYEAVMTDWSMEETVLAFARATEECKYFPSPALLREFSGRAVTGDPIANEAREGLQAILTAMRGPWGPQLLPVPGKVLYGSELDPRDKEGRCTNEPIREKSTPFLLSRRLEATLLRLGWGSRPAGIALIAEHPALKRKASNIEQDDTQYRTNQLRAADDIQNRFIAAYKEVQ
jgi:hypothetical protein